MSRGPLARTSELHHDVDLLAVAGEHGVLLCRGDVGLAGRGVAARIEVRSEDRASTADIVGTALAALSGDGGGGEPGTGPVAFGALGFDPAAPATFVVPSTVVGRSPDGSRWVTTIGDDPAAIEHAVRPAPPERVAPVELRPLVSRDRWLASVAAARQQLRSGRARKVVLARALEVLAEAPISAAGLLGQLQRTYGSCLLYSVEGFVGASPELLVARTGDVVRAQPMAGTCARTGDEAQDAALVAALLASAKDREEHQITIDAVIDALLDHCSFLDAEPEPSVVAMENVAHLASMVEGRLHLPAPSILDLVAALHPTPAVGGHPRAAAMAMIAEHEPLPRGPYAGPVGWVDAQGNGEFAVGIRGASLQGRRAEVWAGVGVVADSDPDAELAETDAKLSAILSALGVEQGPGHRR